MSLHIYPLVLDCPVRFVAPESSSSFIDRARSRVNEKGSVKCVVSVFSISGNG